MSSSDPRSVDPLLTIDERNNLRQSIENAKAKRNDVCQSIEKAEAELQSLLVLRKKVTKNISKLKKTLVIHRILPREIIGYIFSILCTEKVSIPHNPDEIPPQIAVSHVCSKWREIALATPSLWNDVAILKPSCNKWVEVAIELLFNRAGTRGVNIALNMVEIGSNEMAKIVYGTILPLHVKKLRLTLPLSALENLSQKSNEIIANIDEIALSLTSKSNLVPFASNSKLVSITPQFLNKIRSITLFSCGSQRSLVKHLDLQNLPWAQMRHLCCSTCLALSTISDILRQSPLLDVCGINVYQDDEAELTTVLTLPQLRIFHILIADIDGLKCDQDKVLRSFECPNLTDFRFYISHWTAETYKIIENHYNLHRLLRFETSGFPFPVSKVLLDAPMMQELILCGKVFVDERALQGVASGELGRCLTSLGFERNFNVKRVLDMIASRQRYVKQVTETSRSWQDQQISSIKWIILWNYEVKDRALSEDKLGKLGVIVYRSGEPLCLHPLYSLDDY